MRQKIWLCYVSAVRACGPVEVVPNKNDDTWAWVAASKEIEDSYAVCSAPSDVVGSEPKCGLFKSHYGSSCYFITENKEKAETFVLGVRSARAAIVSTLSEDAGPVSVLEADTLSGESQPNDATESADESSEDVDADEDGLS